MKLVTYLTAGSEPRLGAALEESVYDLAGIAQAIGQHLPCTMLEFLTLGEAGIATARQALSRAASAGWPGLTRAGVRLMAPIPRPPKILCLAGNYQEHIEEGGGQRVDKQKVTPRVFIKPATVVIGPEQPILLPRVSPAVDWELELAVVIGRPGRYILAEQALEHVAGYTIFNDVSARRLNIAEGRDPRPGDEWFDWLNGKWLDSFGPMGPYLVTRDEVLDPHDLDMRLTVNGQVKQQGNASQMIFTIPEIIAFISQFVTLEPGDVISTGTPSGVGAAADTYLQPGDVVRGEIEGLGVLENPVQGEK